MSILQALQDFLEGYEGMELRPLGEILTDLTRAAPPSYSLAPAGGGTATQDVVGNRYYTSRYHFFALECAGDEADRAENYDFLESLASWLEDQEDQGNYPELPGRYSVEGIAVQYATLYDISQNGAGLYQVQIELTKVTYESKVTEVSVLEHQYIKGTEEATLFEGVAEEGDIIQFEEPAYDLVASGFSVQSSGANYAVLSAGTGTLTGKKYVHMTRDLRVPVLEDDVDNVIEVKEATLVSLTNSAAVAQRLAGYYQYIEALDHEVVYGGERPGDVVAFEHPYGGESKGCIKDTAITMGGRLVASEQAVIGYVPPKFETEEVLDERVVLTGSGDYTVPEGVYTLTVVCIQAGTGAQAGFDGESGGSSQLIVTSKDQNAGGSWSDSPEDGGQGGDKGSPGAGGKVYRATIDVAPGQVIHYECGTPGVGGATNGAVGAAGGETTFGDLSSAQGASSEIGYVDPVTEEELAKPGTEGVNGAAGGRGGQASSRRGEYGESGEDVPPNTGGQSGTPYEWSYDNLRSEQVRIYGGGAGGGAALGKNGGPGGGETSGKGAEGGDGASPDPPEAPNKIGTGGNGGHGGGGGGGAGGVFASAEPFEFGGAAGIWITNDGGSAGKGSRGSNGGPGGVILYFGVRKKLVSGPIRDKSGRALLDRLGRRLIV